MGTCAQAKKDVRNKENTLYNNQHMRRLVTSQLPLRREASTRRKSNGDLLSELIGLEDVKRKKNTHQKFLCDSLEKHNFFSRLSDKALRALADAATLFSVPEETVIYTRGSIGICFYIIKSGKVEEGYNSILYKGDIFGESIITKEEEQERKHDVKATKHCSIWEISKQKYEKITSGYSYERIKQIYECINQISLFYYLNEFQKESLITEMVDVKFLQDQTINVKNELFIISQGSVLFGGNVIESPAIIDDSYKKFKVLEHASGYRIPTSTLNQLLGKNVREFLQSTADVRSSVNFVHDIQVSSVYLKYMVHTPNKIYPVGTPIFMSKTNYFILQKGILRLVNSEHCLYAYMLIEGNDMEYQCEEKVKITFFEKANLFDSEKRQLEREIEKLNIFKMLKSLAFLKYIPKENLRRLASYVEKKEFQNGEAIINEGDEGTGAFIIKSGSVSVYKNETVVRTLGVNNLFGERAIILNERRTASIIANGQVEAWYIDKENFLNILDKESIFLLIQRMKVQNDSIQLEDMCMVKQLSKGSVSNFFCVVDPKSMTPYRLKTITRKSINEYRYHRFVCDEKKAMLKVDHPFILRLVKSFKDKNRIYFLQEMFTGSDLFEVRKRLWNPEMKHYKFYIACTLLIIEHLHENKILHRNILPENIGIDTNGYPQLIDMSYSKIVASGKAVTIVGVPTYRAPEVITGNPYNGAVDLWALGILLYELITCKLPFGRKAKSPYGIYEEIMNNKPFFDEQLFDLDTIDLMNKLLSRNPKKRDKAAIIKSHHWFKDCEWNSLILKTTEAPYVPQCKSMVKDINRAIVNREQIYKVIKNAEKADISPECPSLRPPTDREWDADF